MNRIQSRVIYSALIACVLVVSAPAAAAPAPATEMTQIMNQVQLFSSYREQVAQTLHQVRIYQSALKDLKQMNPAQLLALGLDANGNKMGEDVRFIAGVAGEIGDTLETVDDAMELLQGEGVIAGSTIDLMRQRGYDLSTADYFASYGALAQVRRDTYGKRYKAMVQATQDAQRDIDRVNKLAASAPQIQSSVQGFGALLQSNAVMSSQLAGVKQVMAQSVVAQTEASQRLAEDEQKGVNSLKMVKAWSAGVLQEPEQRKSEKERGE